MPVLNQIFLCQFPGFCIFTVVACDTDEAFDFYRAYGWLDEVGVYHPHFAPSEVRTMLEAPHRFKIRSLGFASSDVTSSVVDESFLRGT